MAACVVLSRAAAAEKLPSRAIQRNVSRKRRFIQSLQQAAAAEILAAAAM
jgi:hypothetical protein